MGRKETTIAIAIAVNLALVALKFGLASLSGSLSLRASGWHSFSDVVVSAIVLAGLFLARRERVAAQGVSRIEHAVSLLVAGFIFYVGFDIFRDALSGEEPELQNVFWVALGALLTIALSYFMARYKTYVGRATGSPALLADGYHSLMDMYSSIVVVVGLFGYAIGFRSLDRVAAVVVVVLIAFAGYEIGRDALSGLLRRPHLEHGPLAQPFRRLLRTGAPVLAVALTLMYAASGLYVVQPGEVAVVRRFGQLLGADIGPGLRYQLPWPVDKVSVIPVDLVRRAAVPQSLMLTGDQNLVEMAATVHYRVTGATAYLFNLSRPADLVRDAAEAALRQSVALRPIDDVLAGGKAAIQDETQRVLQAQLDAARAGLQVLAVQLSTVQPPQDVASAFLDVASAREDRATTINEAVAYQNEIVPKARGEAAKQLREAEAYRAERIANATGQAQRFAGRLAEYRKAPGVTRTRLYLETVEQVLPEVQTFLVSPGVSMGSLDLWFSRGGSAPVLPPPSLPAPGAPPAPPTPRPTATPPR